MISATFILGIYTVQVWSNMSSCQTTAWISISVQNMEQVWLISDEDRLVKMLTYSGMNLVRNEVELTLNQSKKEKDNGCSTNVS